MAKTRESMTQLGSAMAKTNPSTIIVITPHGLRIEGQFCVVNASNMTGELSEQTVAGMVGEDRADKGQIVTMARRVDRDLARAVIEEARNSGLPVAEANFATSEGRFSTLPLDWGTMIPLYFMPETEIVVVSPSRNLPFEAHLEFGRALASAVQQSKKRVALIASCDWSHAHSTNGPFGYHADAAKLDRQVVEILTDGSIERMMAFDDAFIDHAKPDGIWQSLILAGAIPPEERNPRFLSYEVPTYFGMMCASYV